MTSRVLAPLALFSSLLLPLATVACSGPTTPPMADGGDLSMADSDGDTISDLDEGGTFAIDTDEDGRPDARDDDSDGDGVLDRDEAGDADPATGPVDSDHDGTPDFRDPDSDQNGIADGREGLVDADGDGTPDRADDDDDGDGARDVLELNGRTDFPADHDDDGLPDFRDPDSDGDTIKDGDEIGRDVDGDLTPDVFDLDTDGDGVSDADEAGDDDLATRPIDTDGDMLENFRDADSDDDGLPDGAEIEEGTSPLDPDSDHDGVSDLIEVGAGTDPNDASVNPRTRGDFVFVMPYQEPAEPARDTLGFRSNIAYADVYFLFDTTGSMSTEIASMRGAVEGILGSLTCASSGVACVTDGDCVSGQVCSTKHLCIADPRLTGCIASLWTGVGEYAGEQNSYHNLLALQADSAETRRRMPPGANGGGANETLYESVACVADPTACSGADCVAGGVGCPAYRSDAIRLLVTITDETNQCTGCPVNTAAAAGARLAASDVIFVGVDADAAASPEMNLKEIARAAGSVDAAGEPYYVQGSETAVTAAVTDAIRAIASTRPIFVSIDRMDEPGDDGDALQFIDRLEVNTSGTGSCTAVASVADTDGDSFPDAFPSLLPGTPICWDVVPRDNDRVQSFDRPLVFRARIVVRGDDSVLDARTVYFLVPPTIAPPIG